MADCFTKFSCLLPVGPGNAAAALALYAQMQAEREADDEEIGFEAEQNDPDDDGTLWLWDGGGSGDVENVMAFALRAAEAFDLAGLWGFTWSLTCSKPRPNSFGGGAQMLDLGRRKSLDWLDLEHWIEEQAGKAGIPVQPAETILQPVAEAQGWNHHSQASVLLGFIDSLVADDPVVAERLRTHLAAASATEEDFACRECGAEVFVSDAGTTHHVGRGWDGIDHARDLAETSEMRSICAGSAAKCGAFARCGCDHAALPEKEM